MIVEAPGRFIIKNNRERYLHVGVRNTSFGVPKELHQKGDGILRDPTYIHKS